MANSLDASLSLLKARGISGQVEVELGAEPLQVQTFAGGIGRAKEANVAPLDRSLDLIPFGSASKPSKAGAFFQSLLIGESGAGCGARQRALRFGKPLLYNLLSRLEGRSMERWKAPRP